MKTELSDTVFIKCKHSADSMHHYAPLDLQHMAPYKCVLID